METLRHLLARHAPLLLIDSASTVIHAGLFSNHPDATAVGDAVGDWRWSRREEEAGGGVFRCVEAVLAEAGMRVGDLRAFVFCEGPGSVLGIRTAAVALRTWHALNPAPMFAYQSLSLVASTLDRPGLQVIADARRDSWHVVEAGPATNRASGDNATSAASATHGPLRRVPTTDLRGPLAMPAGFRHWTPLPAGVETVPYDVPALLAAAVDRPLFAPTEEPDAFMHEAPSYATWTPQVHQAPPAR